MWFHLNRFNLKIDFLLLILISWHQGSFYISDGMSAIFKRLFQNTNGSIANLTIFFTSSVSFSDRPCYWNLVIYDNADKWQKKQCKIRFYLVVDQIPALASNPNMVREVKNLSPNFKQVAWKCFTLLNILIWIVRCILSIDSKQFPEKLYSDSLYIVDIICHFL